MEKGKGKRGGPGRREEGRRRKGKELGDEMKSEEEKQILE
jgi:hypothetical protein